jgi:membrane protein DedA with SNARE-associated domain
VEEFLHNWGYLGIFLGIILTGLGFPMPEEVPVVVGGGLVHETNATDYRWWLMLAACIAGVVVGDSCLYLIGRFWGRRLVQLPFVSKRLLPPDRLEHISQNFEKYGVKILLFARMTPGIRAGIFVTAGITKLPWAKFLLADGIYAIPGVTILFFLGYWFTDTIVAFIKETESKAKLIVYLVVLIGVVGYFVYRHLRKPVVEGSPKEMPPVVGPMTNRLEATLEHTLEKTFETVKGRILHPSGELKLPPGAADGPRPAERTDNGQPQPGNGTAQPRDERSQHNS